MSEQQKGEGVRGGDVRYSAPDAGNGATRLRISPGMAAQVEITTGKRSVISYVLSPIAKATGEAGRER